VGAAVSAAGRGLLARAGYTVVNTSLVQCNNVFQNEWRPGTVTAGQMRQQLATTCTKIQLWNLTQYKKVVYLDADVLVLKPIDELFDRPGLAAAPDLMPPDRFNTGVMVIEPNATMHRQILASLPSLSSYDGGDQGFLNSFFDAWFSSPAPHRLPVRYNMLQHMAHLYPPAWTLIEDPAIVHFCGERNKKPWHIHNTDASPILLRPYVQKWWDIYSKAIPYDGRTDL